jgi:hypothetical protein
VEPLGVPFSTPDFASNPRVYGLIVHLPILVRLSHIKPFRVCFSLKVLTEVLTG